MMRPPLSMKNRNDSNAKEPAMKTVLKTLMVAATIASLPLITAQAHAQDVTAAPCEVAQADVQQMALFALPHAGGLRGGDYGV